MTILGSMYSSISGLNSNGTAMEIVGNNISNVNTPAFKFGRPEFSDLLSKALTQGYNVGRGTQIEAVGTIFTQGGFQSSQNVTDLALEGKGFFMVRDVENLGMYYSRAGNFQVDQFGYLVSTQGFRVQGFDVTEDGEATGTEQDIRIESSLLQPASTEEAIFHLNLSSNETIPPAFDVDDPVNTSNFSSSMTVYDSLGNGHQVTSYFRLNSVAPTGNEWEYHVLVDESDWANPVPGTPYYEAATGTLTFDSEGRLLTETATASAFDFSGGAAQGQSIVFDFGTSITTDGGTGLDGTTQFGETSATLFQSQDGFGPSYLESLDFDSDGRVIGKYANGESRFFGRVAVVNFSNTNGLSQLGGNLYGETTQSGNPIIGVGNEAGNGRVFSNTIELSNVDLAEQFVLMITTQRGFQANSRAITTADEMLSETVNMIR